MDQRTQSILEKIIVHYINNAEPIGSRVLSKLMDQKLSPATIRNVMSDLSELGFIEQPHTSAGRIPTDEGYRYYINKVLSEDIKARAAYSVHENEIEYVDFQPSRLEDILLEATSELSTITNCTSIVISPKLSASRLKQIQLIRLSGKQVLAVVVTQIGMVHNKVIHVRACPPQDDLNKMANVLVEQFEKVRISKIRQTLVEELTNKQADSNELIVQSIRLGKKIFDIDTPGELIIAGRSKMCAFPEFDDKQKLRALYRAFEDKTSLTEIMVQAMDNDGIQINIGSENQHSGLNTCSVIAGTYGPQGYHLGSIGIVGPTRLNYPKVISAIQYSTEKLSLSLGQFLDKG